MVTSVVLPGHISLHTGMPSPSITIPSTICLQSLRRSLLLPYWPSVSPPLPVKNSEVVSKNTRSRALNRSRRRANSSSSMRSLVRLGEGASGSGVVERLAEPAHRAVQMLQLEPRGGVDGLVTAPLKRATVGARDHEAVQYGHEHRAFDIEVMAAGGEQLAHDLLAGGLTPQAFEDECRADRDDRGVGRIVCIGGVLCEHHEALGETSCGAQELVDGAAGGEFVEPAQRCNDGLFDALAFAAILRDLKILIRADFLDTDKHAASPSLTPHILGMLSR